jgi:diguanylate cyclase (GGDEF)-like protein/PAS domain S-box-containing protein
LSGTTSTVDDHGDEPATGEHSQDALWTFARQWARAISGTSYVSLSAVEIERYLHQLAGRLSAALRAVPFDEAGTRAVGASLVGTHFNGMGALAGSVSVLGQYGRWLLPDADHAGHSAGQERLAEACGALAAGFTAALRERTLLEQEAIRQALLDARGEAESALRRSEARFRAVFADAAIGILMADTAGRVLEANQALAEMVGTAAGGLRGRLVTESVHPADARVLADAFERLRLGETDHFEGDGRFYRRDGRVLWTFLRVTLVRDDEGRPAFLVGLVEDVTERRSLQSRLRHQATHDPLTGLPNRVLFTERLSELFTRAPAGQRVGVCYLDLDGFKAINDTLGHDIGDKVLIGVAHRLAACAKAGGHLVARMGGDEFVILVADPVDSAQIKALADRVLAALREPLRVAGHELTVSASIGIVERPVAGAHPAEVVRAADVTLYWAKSEGKARWALFDADRNAREVTRYTLSASMPAALERGEFVLEYQPIVRLSDGVVTAAEALVRWRHPQFGLLAPDRFIELAEETGLIVGLGRWVLEQACADAVTWPASVGGGAPVVSVNVAVRQLREPDLVADVRKALAATGLPASRLQLEVTESAVMGSGDGSLDALHTLAAEGVRVAIDDFGTGYSNLAYLRHLPAHALKLDGSFVAEVGQRAATATNSEADGVDERIVATLVSLAHTLSMTVTVEGVESRRQAERLRELGCDAAQGWHYARAVPMEQLTGMLGMTRGDGVAPLERRHDR